MPVTYSLGDLFNEKVSEYKWSRKVQGPDGKKTAMPQSLELRVRLRSHYATNFDDPEHGWRKRYGLIFADTTSLLTFNMDSTPGVNISKEDQYSFASRMETEFPEGQEYILELFQDHYNALKEMPLDPQDALKYGTLQPYILQLRRPTFSKPTSANSEIVREEDAAWPYIHRLTNIPEASWPSNPPVPLFALPDICSTFERVTGSIFSFIGHVVRVENRQQDSSPAQQGRSSTPAYTIKFVDITAPAAGVLKTINIFPNANTPLLHGLLSISRTCPAVAVFTGFSRTEKYVSSTPSSRVTHLLSDADIDDLFHTQLSDVTKATILRHLEDDVHVRNGRSSSILSPSRPTPPPLLQATKSPSKYAVHVVHAATVVPASSPPTTKVVKRRLESPSENGQPTTSAKKNRN